MQRRSVLASALAMAAQPALAASSSAMAEAPGLQAGENTDQAIAALLRTGGVVLAMRHALAPGTFDPPGFRLGECSTQRNLDDAGRDQSRRIGEWMRTHGVVPAAVRSSPWCRCMDTAMLAFGRAESWAALGSPRGASESTNQQSLKALRQALAAVARQPGRFEVWVTHQFVLSDLVGVSTTSGEGLILRAQAEGRPRVLGRLVVA